jgi:hypothetical protein
VGVGDGAALGAAVEAGAAEALGDPESDCEDELEPLAGWRESQPELQTMRAIAMQKLWLFKTMVISEKEYSNN